VVASPEAPVPSVTALEQNGVRVSRPETLAAGLRELREAGIQSLLCEGGGALGMRLLADELVDRLYWVQSPVWLGEGAVPAFPGVPNAPLPAAPRWTPVERRVLGVDTLLVVDKQPCLPGS
jgi:riboflavin biosynthesis pyrimidine reductase